MAELAASERHAGILAERERLARVRAVEAGATGVLLKDTPREELFRAVRAAARGESVLAPAVTARLLGRLRARSRTRRPTGSSRCWSWWRVG